MQLHKLIEELEKLEIELGENVEVEIVLDYIIDARRLKLDEVNSIDGKKVILIHRAMQ